MPTTKTVTEYEFHEFEQLVIAAFGLMPDYAVVAAEEWNNDECHSFAADSALAGFERAQLDAIYAAASAYTAAVAANGGVDPDAGAGLHPKVAAITQARVQLARTLHYNTHLLFAGLVEQQIIPPGEYLINVCW